MLDRPVMVAPEHARMVMEIYIAADLSAEINEPVDVAALEYVDLGDCGHQVEART